MNNEIQCILNRTLNQPTVLKNDEISSAVASYNIKTAFIYK